MIPLDTDDLARRYLAGEPLDALAKSVGVSLPTVRERLRKAGVPLRTRVEATRLAKVHALDVPAVVGRYQSGESEQAIARSLGVARSVVRRTLREAGISLRGRAEANSLRMAKLGPAGRLLLTNAAHAAVRGVPQSEELRCKIALSRERNAARRSSTISPTERTLAGWLKGRGIEVTPQKAVGPYNVDVALTESRIAVEIFGGNWHASRRHAGLYRPRLEYLADRDWHPVIVWVTTSYRLAYCVVEQVIALHETCRRGEPLGRQEHVIRGDGYVAAVDQVKPDNGAIVLGFHPGNPNRGDDGRFRKAAAGM